MNGKGLFNEQYRAETRTKPASTALGRVVDAQAFSKLAWSLATGLAGVYDKQESYLVMINEGTGYDSQRNDRLIAIENISFSENTEPTSFGVDRFINFSASLRGGNRRQYISVLNRLVDLPEFSSVLKDMSRLQGISTLLEEPVSTFLSVRLSLVRAGSIFKGGSGLANDFPLSIQESWVNIGSELSICGGLGRIPSKFASPMDNGYIYLSVRGNAGLDELAFGHNGEYAVYRKNEFRDLILNNHGSVTKEEMELVKFTYPEKKILLDGIPEYGTLTTSKQFLDERRYQIGQKFGLGTINTFKKEDL